MRWIKENVAAEVMMGTTKTSSRMTLGHISKCVFKARNLFSPESVIFQYLNAFFLFKSGEKHFPVCFQSIFLWLLYLAYYCRAERHVHRNPQWKICLLLKCNVLLKETSCRLVPQNFPSFRKNLWFKCYFSCVTWCLWSLMSLNANWC